MWRSPTFTAPKEARYHTDMSTFALAIHGGAGTIPKEDMPPTREKAYRQGLEDALKAGHAVLSAGGAALDAVEAAVQTAGGRVRDAWDGAAQWDRGSEFLADLVGALGLKGEQVDQMFREADAIRG